MHQRLFQLNYRLTELPVRFIIIICTTLFRNTRNLLSIQAHPDIFIYRNNVHGFFVQKQTKRCKMKCSLSSGLSGIGIWLLVILLTIAVEGQQRNRNRANSQRAQQGAAGNRQQIDPAALLIGAAGLAAVAGTAGFVGGLIVGESDNRVRPGNRRPINRFRGKREAIAGIQNEDYCLSHQQRSITSLFECLNAGRLLDQSFR